MAASDTPYAYIPDPNAANPFRLVGALPLEWEQLVNGRPTGPLITNLPNRTPVEQESTGWFLIDTTTNSRPADTTTDTWSSGFVLVNGRPVEQWTRVAKTAKQIQDETRTNNAVSLTAAQRTGFGRVKAIAAFVPPDLTNFTTPQLKSELTLDENAIVDLAKAVKGLARLVVGADLLDPVND